MFVDIDFILGQHACIPIETTSMDVTFDTDDLRSFFLETGLSNKQLRDRHGLTRAETDLIDLHEEFLVLPLGTIVKLAKAIGVNPIRITGSYAVPDLLANFPLVEEADFSEAEAGEDEYHLVGPSTANQIQIATSETESWNTVGAIEASKLTWANNGRQAAELAAMQRSPHILLGGQVGWLASVPAEKLLAFEADFIEFETGLLAANSSQKSLSTGVASIKDLAKRADKSNKAGMWSSFIDSTDYRIFYLRLARRLDLSVTMVQENIDKRFPSDRYDFIVKPRVYRDLFIITEPKTDYVLVRAKRFESRTRYFDLFEEGFIDSDVFKEHSVDVTGEE
jgi:hypothetical protein